LTNLKTSNNEYDCKFTPNFEKTFIKAKTRLEKSKRVFVFVQKTEIDKKTVLKI
jgi:hypothetical protein